MKLTTKRIVFIVMILLLITALITSFIVLDRVLDFFRPAGNSQLSDKPPAGSNSPDNPADSSVPDHVHAFTVEKTTKASCDGAGYTLYSCPCGKTDIRDFTQPLGHKYGEYTTVPATCESDGYTERICSRCHTPERTNIIPAEHSFDDWMPNDAAPQESRICAVCQTTEIRSADFSQTWVLRLPPQEQTGTFNLYRVTVDLLENEDDPVYEIYMDTSLLATGFDYADSCLSVLYASGELNGTYTFPADGTVVTLYADGSISTEAPVIEEPDPEPEPAPEPEPEPEPPAENA